MCLCVCVNQLYSTINKWPCSIAIDKLPKGSNNIDVYRVFWAQALPESMAASANDVSPAHETALEDADDLTRPHRDADGRYFFWVNFHMF